MSNAMIVSPLPPPEWVGRGASCPGARLAPPVAKVPSFFKVVQEGNKIDRICLDRLWEFRVLDADEVVGFMRDSVQREMIWDDADFYLDHDNRTIHLDPEVQPGEDPAAACRRAFTDLMERNKGKFNNGLDSWIAKPASRREFQPLHVTTGTHQDLCIPLPARGLFGVVTLGVHLNVYTVRNEGGHERIDRIWVSQRATGEAFTYSGMLDQVVAGGMDPTDRIAGLLAPAFTLKREAHEEAGLLLDLETRTMSVKEGNKNTTTVVGTVEEATPLTFYDCKGRDAGLSNEGHLEPGVRFVYDLKLDDPDFQPHKEENSIEKFEVLTVDEVKRRLRERRWKPNCGLVMLDFLIRKNLVTEAEEERFAEIIAGLRRQLPFSFVQDGFPYLVPWI